MRFPIIDEIMVFFSKAVWNQKPIHFSRQAATLKAEGNLVLFDNLINLQKTQWPFNKVGKPYFLWLTSQILRSIETILENSRGTCFFSLQVKIRALVVPFPQSSSNFLKLLLRSFRLFCFLSVVLSLPASFSPSLILAFVRRSLLT